MWTLCLALVAAGQEAPTLLADAVLGAETPFASELPLYGEVRLRGDWLADPAVDLDGTTTGRGAWGTSRVRVGAQRTEGRGAGALELELLSGRWGGGTALGTA